MMYSYFAYGLKIKSKISIPEFIYTKIEDNFDITICLKKDYELLSYVPQDIMHKRWAISLSLEKAIYYIKDIAAFEIKNGNKITVIPAPNSSERSIRLYLVGTIMAILLYQRELLVLHASVVNIDGGAVAFLGKSGEGKSSMAAIFSAHGYPFLTDDVAPVNLSHTIATIAPGFPQIKLSREMADTLGYDFDSLLVLDSTKDKRGYRFTKNFLQSTLPIRGIYILSSDEEFGIEPLNPMDAAMELVKHSRPTTFHVSGGSPHFLQCTALAKKHTIYRLKRPRDLALLPKLVELVEEHVKTTTKTSTENNLVKN